MKKHLYIGKIVRRDCITCGDKFKTTILDTSGTTINTMCANCKADRKARIMNGQLKENDKYHVV